MRVNRESANVRRIRPNRPRKSGSAGGGLIESDSQDAGPDLLEAEGLEAGGRELRDLVAGEPLAAASATISRTRSK
ncbi:MAG: hypothetical protein R3B46_11615 [Phycisphaerales bacterium]